MLILNCRALLALASRQVVITATFFHVSHDKVWLRGVTAIMAPEHEIQQQADFPTDTRPSFYFFF